MLDTKRRTLLYSDNLEQEKKNYIINLFVFYPVSELEVLFFIFTDIFIFFK